MDEDYETLLESEFTSDNHDAVGEGVGVGVDEESAQALRDQLFSVDTGHGLPDNHLDAGPSGAGLADHGVGAVGALDGVQGKKGKRRRNTGGGSLPDEEKKTRQRAQNRVAAEKSRSKKKDQL